jgi:hypothetical protein
MLLFANGSCDDTVVVDVCGVLGRGDEEVELLETNNSE